MGDLSVGKVAPPRAGGGREPVYRTRLGTPMIGPYSINQMDDFYDALGHGQVRPSGVMNYIQHLYVAERCRPGARVVDVCCGRGLQLPVLYRYAAHLERYVGLDIAPGALAEARARLANLDQAYGERPFDVKLLACDVAAPWPECGPFDVAVYTSAVEHLPRQQAVASLDHIAAALVDGGRLYLSTPNTAGPAPRPLQYGVHVHEWHAEELVPVLEAAGFAIDETIGLLPPPPTEVAAALNGRFGPGAADWYDQLRATVPAAFLDVVAAAAVPDVAAELLYVCTRGPR
jgi:SAM-dependent methyltransferase